MDKVYYFTDANTGEFVAFTRTRNLYRKFKKQRKLYGQNLDDHKIDDDGEDIIVDGKGHSYALKSQYRIGCIDIEGVQYALTYEELEKFKFIKKRLEKRLDDISANKDRYPYSDEMKDIIDSFVSVFIDDFDGDSYKFNDLYVFLYMLNDKER